MDASRTWVLKTAASACMARCILPRIWAVLWAPAELRSLSRRCSVSSPASAGRGGCSAPGLDSSAAQEPQTSAFSHSLGCHSRSCTDLLSQVAWVDNEQGTQEPVHGQAVSPSDSRRGMQKGAQPTGVAIFARATIGGGEGAHRW